MKHLLLRFLVTCICCLTVASVRAQAPCLLSDIATTPRILPSAFPYTNPGTGLMTTARLVGGGTISNATYSCSGINYDCAATSWYMGNTSAFDSLILTFSAPVTSFSVVVNATNYGEQFTFTPVTGTATLNNYCTASFATVASNELLCSAASGVGTMITVTNPAGATQYVITHNGAGAGSRISLLDCISSIQGPADITRDIEFWLNGSDVNNNPGTNPADSTKLGIWKDISGNDNHAYVLAGQDTPTFRSAQINGKDVLRFKRSSTFYGTIYNVPGTDIRADSMPQTTIFTVYRPAARVATDYQGIWGNDNGGWDRFFLPAFGSVNGLVSVGPPINYAGVTGAGTVGAVRLLTTVYDHGKTDSSAVYFNALPVATVTDNTDGSAAQSTFRIGWDGDDNPFDGDIAEMILYKRKLTECEIKAVNRYFGYKYGVTLTTALVTPSTTQYICPSSTVALKASKGDAFQWLKDGAAIATATDSVYAAPASGRYAVVVTKGGCSDTSLPTLVTMVPAVIYVDSSKATSASGASWDSSKRTVTEALALAHQVSCPVQIWVKKGTYYPAADNNRDSSFRISRNGIQLYGGFNGTETLLSARSVSANPTILSGDVGVTGDSTDNSYHVITVFAKSTAQIDTNTVIDGFTITRGNAQFAGSFSYSGISYNRQDGAGAHLWGAGGSNKCNPLITNCTFTRNAANYGGGIYNAGFSTGTASPVLRNNTFSYNKANTLGGGVFNNGQNSGNSSPVTTGCIFTGNNANYGGGMYNQATGSGVSNGAITDCIFSSNTAATNGGGLALAYSIPQISNCTFTKNSAAYSGGAFFQEGGTSTFKKNVFDQNTASIGGAIRIYVGDPNIVLTNNIFYRNIATGNDGGAMSIVSGNGKDTIINNLFVYNKGTGSGPNGGGALVQENGTSTYVVSNTFYADSSTGNGGALHFKDNGSNRYLYNNILYKNYNGSAVNDYTTASGAAITASGNNLFSTTDPRFVNPANPTGADGIWLTADDGLELLPCSPAVNAASASAPTLDIRSRARLGLPDIGAYEEQTGILPTAPVTTTPVTYCQNAVAIALTATKTSATDTLKWYNGVPALLPGAPVPVTTDTGNFTFYVSQTNIAGCEGAKTRITVRINIAPAIPAATSPVVYCQNAAAVALTATKGATADTLKWYDAVPAALSGAPTPSTTATGNTTYYVSSKNNFGCESPKKTIVVTVNPTPAAPTATTPVVYCQGAVAVALTATKGAAADTLRWYDAVPALLGGAPVPSTSTPGNTTYYVSGKNNFGCEGPKKTIIVTVNPTPAAPVATTPVTYCQDDVAVALTATKASATDTLKWYTAVPALLPAAPVPGTATPGTTIYYVSDKTALGCEGPKTAITVTVNPKPAAPAVISPVDRCFGIPGAALTASGTGLKWYTAVSGGTPSATLTPSAGSVGATTYYVSQTTLLGCEGPRAALTVNVRPSPVVSIAPSGAPAFVYCHDDSITIKASSATAIDYQWYRNTITMTGSVADSITVKTTADYSVTVKDHYGCADTESVRVIENPLPVPTISPTNVNICPGVSIVLYANPATVGYIYQWSKDGVPMGIATTEDHTPVNAAGTYTIKVTDIYNCVLTTNNSLVNLYPVMATPVIDRTGTVLRTRTSYATYQWYRNGKLIPGAISRSYTMSFDGDYYVVVFDENGCTATSESYNINGLGIDPQATARNIRLFPNPAQTRVTIESDLPVNVRVTDVTGRLILQQRQVSNVDLSSYADGIYLFTLTDMDGVPVLIEKVNKVSR